MKKFVKYGTIAGCALILVGVGVTTASLALGADPMQITEFVNERFGYGEHRSPASTQERTLVAEGTRAAESGPWMENIEDFGEEMEGLLEGTMSFLGENNFEAGYPAVTDLDVHQRGGTAEVILTSGDVLTVKGIGMQLGQLRYDGTDHWQKLSISVPEGAKCQILIPESWSLKDLDVEVTGGIFWGESLNVQDAEYKAMGGEISVSQAGGASLELECEDGVLNWTGIGSIPSKTEADCRSGSISIRIPKGLKEEDFSYKLECEDGELNLPRFALDGKEKKTVAGQTGMPFFELEAENNGVIELMIE